MSGEGWAEAEKTAGAAARSSGGRPCPCGAVAGRRIEWASPLSGPRYAYLACDACGTLLLDPRPTDEQLAAAYDPSYFGTGGSKFILPLEPIVGLSRAHRVHVASALLRQVAGPGRRGRVLDLGCGDGSFLERLQARGHGVAGTELSPSTAARAARIAGLDLRLGPLAPDSFAPESFHLVSAWHVLEHLPDPGLALRLCRRWLVPGGALVLAVPNAGSWQARTFRAAWFHLDPPRHLYQFSAASLRQVLAAAGFAPVSTRHFTFGQNVYGVLQSALNALGGRPAELYELLKGNPRPASPLRFALPLLAGALLFLPSLAFAWAEALARAGGTIELVAVKST